MKSFTLLLSLAFPISLSAQVVIDNGRQLFIDDHVIEQTDLQRVWHHPEKYEGNPVLMPETSWEMPQGGNATARPNGGGIWWDEKDRVFKMWYEGGWLHSVCYAESRDGINWVRPELDVVPGTNIVLPLDDPSLRPDSWSVVKDPDAKNPDEQYKMMIHRPWSEPWGVPDGACLVSSDGIHWRKVAPLPSSGDRSTMYYDPFREKWVFSLRSNWTSEALAGGPRNRMRYELDDFCKGPAWLADVKDRYPWAAAPNGGPERWLDCDEDLDPLDASVPGLAATQLYSFDAVAYESVMLGMMEIHIGPENGDCEAAGMPKITDLKFAFSRDGVNFFRPDGAAAIASERWPSGAWDAGYVQPVSNLCVINGDELWFYYGAFAGEPARANKDGRTFDWTVNNGMYANASTGIARLRRDGFVSLDGSGSVVTKPLYFSGDRLYVNVCAPKGSIAAEILDIDGNVIDGYSARDSRIRKVDSTKLRISWKKHPCLSMSKIPSYRIRFILEDASLYSFWISADERGASNGYLAGGGPGYEGLRDVPSLDRSSVQPQIAVPDGKHSHGTRSHEGIPSLAVTPDGIMWATWYGGPTPNEDENNYLVLSRSSDGTTWEEVLYCDPDLDGPRRCFDPEIFVSPDGLLRWTWTDRVGTVRSLNGGDQLWMATIDPSTGKLCCEPQVIARGVMMNKPCFLPDGTWLMPVAHWYENPSACVYASTDGGRTFQYRGGARVPQDQRGFDEHTVLSKKDGTLKMYIRTFSPGNALWEAESCDGGHTWTDAVPSRAGSLSSRTFVTALADGRWLMVKHGGYSKIPGERRDLTALISEDEGKTWWGGLILDDRTGCSYPDGQELPDGRIVVVSDYDRVGAREISYVVISPEEILAGSAGHCQPDSTPYTSVKSMDRMPERKIISVVER